MSQNLWLYDAASDPDVLKQQVAQILNRFEELKSELKTALKEKEEAVELVDQIRDENEQCLTANRHLTKELKKLESIILSLKKQRTISEEELSVYERRRSGRRAQKEEAEEEEVQKEKEEKGRTEQPQR